MVTMLRNLTIDRVAFVPAGDDPDAQVVLWKAKDAAREGGEPMRKENGMLAAVRALGEGTDRVAAMAEGTRARADALLARGRGGSVSKAEDAAARLHALAQREIDRRPHDGRGREVTVEMALAKVIGTPEGRRAMNAVRAEGPPGDAAVRKLFSMPSNDEPEATPTRGELELEALAKARARASGRTWQAELATLAREPRGRELVEKHRTELAAR